MYSVKHGTISWKLRVELIYWVSKPSLKSCLNQCFLLLNVQSQIHIFRWQKGQSKRNVSADSLYWIISNDIGHSPNWLLIFVRICDFFSQKVKQNFKKCFTNKDEQNVSLLPFAQGPNCIWIPFACSVFASFNNEHICLFVQLNDGKGKILQHNFCELQHFS